MVTCVRTIPRKLGIGFCTGLFSLFYYIYRERRLIANHNLKSSFPEEDMAEIATISKGV
jgi:lauroyl/myristoyl acyltransferase